ncbi:oligosaccharide flippase family protein [Arthrobacter sp. FW306-2-2C-D06B]|nr:oligosaccharide flippase family protein [Arthrobacter sp. FW306-2-2C-D06B]UKA57996.1 oligosaccharide flippase family protein [Arthrobacter sp. FW306-2-2C-D06B]
MFLVLRTQTIRPAVRRTATSLVFRLFGLLIGIVTNAVLARSLGVSEFGQFGVGLTILTIITQLSDFGAVQAMTAEARRNPKLAGHVAGSGICIRLITAFIGIAIAIPISLFTIPNTNAVVLIVIAVCAPLGASGALIALSNARLRPEIGSALTLGQSALWMFAVLIVGFSDHPTAIDFAFAFAMTTALQTLITLAFYGRKSMIGRPTWAVARLLLSKSWPVGLLGLLVTSYYRVGGVLVIGLAGAHEAGLYTAAYKVIDVAQIIPSLIVVPMLPVLIDALAQGSMQLQRLSKAVIRLSVIVAIGSGLMIALFSDVIVRLIYGDAFGNSARVLEVLGLAFVGITLGYVGSTLCFAIDRVKRQIPFVAVLGVLSLMLQPWAIGNWGGLGSAYVAAATEIAMSVLSLTLCAGPLGMSFRSIFGWRYPLFVLIIVCTYFLTKGSFVIGVIVCPIVFVIAMLFLKLVGKHEGNLILRRKSDS